MSPCVSPPSVVREERADAEDPRDERVAVRDPREEPSARVVPGVEREREERRARRHQPAKERVETGEQRGEPEERVRVHEGRAPRPEREVEGVRRGREGTPERDAKVRRGPPRAEVLHARAPLCEVAAREHETVTEKPDDAAPSLTPADRLEVLVGDERREQRGERERHAKGDHGAGCPSRFEAPGQPRQESHDVGSVGRGVAAVEERVARAMIPSRPIEPLRVRGASVRPRATSITTTPRHTRETRR